MSTMGFDEEIAQRILAARTRNPDILGALGAIGSTIPGGVADDSVYQRLHQAVQGGGERVVDATNHLSHVLDNTYGALLRSVSDPDDPASGRALLGALAHVAMGMGGETVRIMQPLTNRDMATLVGSPEEEHVTAFLNLAMQGGTVLFEREDSDSGGSNIALLPVTALMQGIDHVTSVEINQVTGEQRVVTHDFADPEQRQRLLSEGGFQVVDVVMSMTVAYAPNTPYVALVAPVRMSREEWEALWPDQEYNPRILTVHVSHRQYGHLMALAVAELDEQGRFTLRVQEAFYETVEQHADGGNSIIAADPFSVRPESVRRQFIGESDEGYEALRDLPDPVKASPGDMLRALADVLDGKSNRIEWDQRFDDEDDEELDSVLLGRRRVKA